jgi:hypothetical protein
LKLLPEEKISIGIAPDQLKSSASPSYEEEIAKMSDEEIKEMTKYVAGDSQVVATLLSEA